MATNPYTNKVEYNGDTLIDISDTTATSDKVQTGYKIYGADGSPIYGTATQGVGITITDTTDPVAGGTFRDISGQLIGAYDAIGGNCTLVKTINFPDVALSSTTFSSTETANKTIKATASTGQTHTCDMSRYEYLYRMYMWVAYKYTEGATQTAMPLYTAYVMDYAVGRWFSNLDAFLNNNYNYNEYFNCGFNITMYAYNNSGALARMGGSNYGIYLGAPSFGYGSRTNTSFVLTLYYPAIACSANNTTYFSAATRAALDTTNTIIKWKADLYQVDKDTLYYRTRYTRIISDLQHMINNG